MNNQNAEFELEAATIRSWFAKQLIEMSQVISQSEQQAKMKGASGALDISKLAEVLEIEADLLKNGKFRFLIIGDFNRGKSTILNVVLGQSLLPMGVTPTTAIPTFIKYGEKEEVVVHKKVKGKQKVDQTERLSFEEYKQKYTLNSKEVKNAIKKALNSVANWLENLNYAELYCPVNILSQGVEFIDTAGLNHTPEENLKTFSYISECHAIIFVLSADYQFTQQEREYLKTLLGQKKELEDNEARSALASEAIAGEESLIFKPRPIFYLINKWETVEDAEKEETLDYFVNAFSEALDITEKEAESMWGNTIFNVYAKTALSNLSKGESIEGTGLKEFQRRLSNFVTNERLIVELKQAVSSAESANSLVGSQVDLRLRTLTSTISELEKSIQKVDPHIRKLKEIPQNLKRSVTEKRSACLSDLKDKYQTFFYQLVKNIEREFEMPPVAGLKESQREQYTKDLETKLSKYRNEKLSDWQSISRGILLSSLSDLKQSFDEEGNKYIEIREQIREELNPSNFALQTRQNKLNSQYDSSNESSLRSADAGATGKMILGASGGTLGTVAAGIGGATVANLAGAHIVLGTVGAGLALTPVGWVLLGASAAVGGGVAWWQRHGEIQKFQIEMLAEVKREFEKLLDPDNIAGFEERIKETFAPFDNSARRMSEDVLSLEKSLVNLLEAKKVTEVDTGEEEKRLKTFSRSIFDLSVEIKKKYDNMTEYSAEREM